MSSQRLAERELMEAAFKYRRLRAPQEDGGRLFHPPQETWQDAADENRRQLLECDYDVQGRSLSDLAHSARRSFLRATADYTATYTGLPEGFSPGMPPDGPVLVSGHQPQLFHPGVWLKNFAVGSVAHHSGGVGIHLIIDSDLCRTASMRVPAGTHDQPRAEVVDYDLPEGEIPFEERTVQEPSLLASFPDRVKSALIPIGEEPILPQFWPLVVEKHSGIQRLGLRLAQARHRWERQWGNTTLEIPLSLACRLEEFHWLVAHLLAHLPRFWTAHNTALAEYRRTHRLRNRAHPVPDLEEDDGWLEAPLWIWTNNEPTRRHLFARQSDDQLLLSDRNGWKASLALSADGSATDAVEQLAALAESGVKIRTRALTTTLFARLLLCDLFVHGIGGARYDQVTDELIRGFFGIAPPCFAACSATLRLPLSQNRSEQHEIQDGQHALRELTYHPERFLSHSMQDGSNEDPKIAQLVAEKRRWIDKPKTPEGARERHQAIVAVNQALQPYLAELRSRLLAQTEQYESARRAELILNSREYSFCLHSEQRLRRLLLDDSPTRT